MLLFQHGHFSLFTQWLGSPEIVLSNLHASFSEVEPPIFRVISIQTSCRTCVTLVRCQISCHVRCHAWTPGSGDLTRVVTIQPGWQTRVSWAIISVLWITCLQRTCLLFPAVLAKTCSYYLQKAFKINVTTNILLAWYFYSIQYHSIWKSIVNYYICADCSICELLDILRGLDSEWFRLSWWTDSSSPIRKAMARSRMEYDGQTWSSQLKKSINKLEQDKGEHLYWFPVLSISRMKKGLST